MKTGIPVGWTAVLAALVLSAPLSAHHSIGAFETATPVHVKGTVVRYTWANPHSAIVVEQKTEAGETIRWAFESSAPTRLLEASGFTRDSFKPGDVIEACGFPLKAALGPEPTSDQGDGGSGPVWMEGVNRIITARLLLTKDGPKVHWSHYGPLELCTSEEALAVPSR